MSTVGWIGVDLDGTLAFYDKWRGEEHIGPPIEPMVTRIKDWLSKGVTVKIVTARVSTRGRTPLEVAENIVRIQEWCLQHIGEKLDVTCSKDYAMVELWDDRAVQVIPNTGEAVIDRYKDLMERVQILDAF